MHQNALCKAPCLSCIACVDLQQSVQVQEKQEHEPTCRPQQKDCSEAAKSSDWPCVRVTRMESTTVMLKALVKDASMSAAMASEVVCTLENPTQTPAPAKGK